MKIGSFESKPVSATQVNERKGAAGSTSAKGVEPAAEPSAQVALSPAASLLVKVADDPAFDTAKVERIAAAIREGKYEINAEAIADKLIVNAEELLGRKIG
ncbi:MAG: flagellar biosynthesis anti-sigma factor FlgM [Burkholderiales bacterium]|nr:flagellar biosynthesis anti-sigma factor FlgM [Burkholderiales bacterium]